MLKVALASLLVMTALGCNSGANLKGNSGSNAGAKPATGAAAATIPPTTSPPSVTGASTSKPKTSTPGPEEDPSRVTGDELSDAGGFYDSDKWGKMLIEIQGDDIYGTYAFRFGTHKGTIDRATGVASVVWCEGDTDDQSPRAYRGIAEFVFQKGDAAGLRLKGKWKTGGNDSAPWIEDWDITKVTKAPPKDLEERLANKKAPFFCDTP